MSGTSRGPDEVFYTGAMNHMYIINSLERFPAVLSALVADFPDAQLRWKPADGAWSILEVLCHLRDEEIEDFRPRLQATLRDPNEPWTPIDPEGVAVARKYNEDDPPAALDRFVSERGASIAWLRSLSAVNWRHAHQHPRVGPVPAGNLLLSWAAHDALHLRQIAKRLHQLAEDAGSPFSSDYAGVW